MRQQEEMALAIIIIIIHGLIIMERSSPFFRRFQTEETQTGNKDEKACWSLHPWRKLGLKYGRHIFRDKERSWWGGWRQWSSSVLRSVSNSLANLWSPEHGQKDDICEPQQTSSWDSEGVSENIPPLECLWQISCRNRAGGEKGVGVGMCVAPGNQDSFSDVENREDKRMTEESLKKL